PSPALFRSILASKPPPEGHEHRHDDDEHQPGREITHRAHPPFKGGAWHPALPSLNITTECRRCYWCLPDGRTARPPRNTAGRRSCSRGRTGTEERKSHPRTPRSTGRRTSCNCRSSASCRSSPSLLTSRGAARPNTNVPCSASPPISAAASISAISRSSAASSTVYSASTVLSTYSYCSPS